jgi:hypothetical protein
MRRGFFSLLLVASAASAAERTLHFSQPLGDITTLQLEAGVGDVSIVGSEREDIAATVVVSGKRWQLEEVDVEASRLGSILLLSLKPKFSPGKKLGMKKETGEDWQLRLPQKLAVKLQVGVGDVRIRNMQGPLFVQVGVGDIWVSPLASDLRAETGVGDVEVQGPWSQVGKLQLTTGIGSITLHKPEGRAKGQGLLSESLQEKGPGQAKVVVSTGVGHITLRLRED